MNIKKFNLFYVFGFLFFFTIFLIGTVKKVELLVNNTYAEGIYSNGFVYIYKEDKIVDKGYRAITDTKIKENKEVSFLYNIENESAYVLNYNRIIREEFFLLILMVLFLVLIIKNPRK